MKILIAEDHALACHSKQPIILVPSNSGHHATCARQLDGPLAMRGGADDGPAPLVFVVDDDPMMAALIGAAMQTAGYRVRIFNDGTEAVALAEKLPPDLLLVDLAMPQLSGAETMTQLREQHPRLPVVVVSGLPLAEAHAAAPTASAFVEKPFKIATLLRTVASLRPK